MKQVKEKLARIGALVEGWQARGYAGELERDLALDLLQEIYAAIKFRDAEPEPDKKGAEVAASPAPAPAPAPAPKPGESENLEEAREDALPPKSEAEVTVSGNIERSGSTAQSGIKGGGRGVGKNEGRSEHRAEL
jgi:hypothetical protein